MALALPVPQSPNYAPLEPLQAAIRRKQGDKTVEVTRAWFHSVKTELEREEEATWNNQISLWQLTFGFIAGNALGRRGKNGSWRWIPLPESTDQPIYGLNLARFYSRNVKAKWTQSNTDVIWRASSDADEAEGAAKAATHVHDFYRSRLYTQDFRQTEAALAQCGKYVRYYYYSEDAKRYARRAVTERKQVRFGDGAYFCVDCGYGGSAGELGGAGFAAEGLPGGLQSNPDAGWATSGAVDDPAQPGMLDVQPGAANEIGIAAGGLGFDGGTVAGGVCPHCGSPNLEIEPPASLEVESLAGYEQYETGDIVCECVPPFEVKHDIAFSPQDSPYLIRKRRVRTALLQSKFPHVQISRSRSDDRGLQAADQLKRAAYDQTPTRTDSGDDPATDFTQVWLDPCLYGHLILKEAFQTVAGEEMPAGTRLAEVFPTGMYLAFIEGVEGVVEVRDEHHREFFVGGEYDKKAMSALGAGLEDVVQGGMQYNLVMSIIYMQLRSSALPATLFEQKLLPNGVSSYLGSLANIPVDSTILDGRRLQDAVHQLQPQPPSQQHFGYAQQLNNYMQLASCVTDFSGGLPGVNNTTATGAQIAAANSQGLFAPQLALKAEVDREGAERILALFRKYTHDQVYVALSGKRGEQAGRWLSAADIEVDIYAEVVPDSYLPQTNMERRERWDGFLARVGGLPGLRAAMQEMPGQVERLAELFDVDLGGEDYTAAAQLCRARIEQMKKALPSLQVWMQGMPPMQMAADPMTGEMMAVPVDPMQEAGNFLLGILEPPVEKEELGHMSSIRYLRSWLTEDEGLKAPPELRAGVKMMIYAHIEGVMAEAQMTGLVGMMGQPMAAPPPEGEQKEKKPGGQTNTNPQAGQMTGQSKKQMPRKSVTDQLVRGAQMGAMA